MKLEPLQTNFFEWVAGSDEIPAEAASQVVNATGTLDAATRVSIYAEMYWLRVRDVLRDDFSRVLKVVGDEAFEVLVATYIRKHPSQHFSLGSLGRHFAESLTDAEPAWLSSMAKLEWARSRSFIAPNSELAAPSALAIITEETFARVRMTATPSVRVIELSHDVLQPATPPPERKMFAVVWRKAFEVFHVEVPAEEAQALRLLLETPSTHLAALCEPFTEPQAAFTAIASWVNEGMVASLFVDDAESA